MLVSLLAGGIIMVNFMICCSYVRITLIGLLFSIYRGHTAQLYHLTPLLIIKLRVGLS